VDIPILSYDQLPLQFALEMRGVTIEAGSMRCPDGTELSVQAIRAPTGQFSFRVLISCVEKITKLETRSGAMSERRYTLAEIDALRAEIRAKNADVYPKVIRHEFKIGGGPSRISQESSAAIDRANSICEDELRTALMAGVEIPGKGN